MSKSQEEQIKLFASYLNTIAAGTIVTGIVAPVVASIINPGLGVRPLLYFGLLNFGLSLILHGFAQATLERLSE